MTQPSVHVCRAAGNIIACWPCRNATYNPYLGQAECKPCQAGTFARKRCTNCILSKCECRLVTGDPLRAPQQGAAGRSVRDWLPWVTRPGCCTLTALPWRPQGLRASPRHVRMPGLATL